eukprot:4343416-Pleurochrysis_carterae.AAC.1
MTLAKQGQAVRAEDDSMGEEIPAAEARRQRAVTSRAFQVESFFLLFGVCESLNMLRGARTQMREPFVAKCNFANCELSSCRIEPEVRRDRKRHAAPLA